MSRLIQKFIVFLVALAMFTLVVLVGSWSSTQISKREFETEARNIVAVLRGGLNVVDGLVTSLDASAYSTVEGTEELQSHLATVLAKYDYVVGLGRFDKTAGSEVTSFVTSEGGMWRYNRAGNKVAIQSGPATRSHYPLSFAKFRTSTDVPLENLIGYDLGSVWAMRRAIENKSSQGRLVVMEVPFELDRPGHVWVFLTSGTEAGLDGGYLAEVDVEQMAASGGVTYESFGLSISKFGDQGEFESTASSNETLYSKEAQSEKDSLLSRWISDDLLLSTFDIGDKTLIVEVWRKTGLSGVVVALFATLGALLAVMFYSIVHLYGRRRHAQKRERLQREELYQTQHRAAVTLASIGDGVITADVSDTVLYANQAAEALLGYNLDQMQGKSMREILIPKSNSGDNVTVDPTDGEKRITLRSADGSAIYVDKKESELKHSDGGLSGKVVVLRDVSTEHKLTQELQHRVNHDSLTGLSNRFSFEQQMAELFEGADFSEFGHVVCVIDLDRFKEVNDTCGHMAGDELLIRIARAFETNVRETDLIARLGGDEFGIVLRNCLKPDGLMIANRIRNFFQNFYFDYDGHVFPVRCSIGIVHFDPAHSLFEDVIKAADSACFAAKKRGRNSICEGNLDNVSSEAESEVQFLPKIKDALDNDGFTLFVQPVATLTNNEAAQHEILLRMSGDDGEVIKAASFMKIAQRYDLAIDIDRWVVKHALEAIFSLPAEFENHKFTINLTAQAICSDKFIEFLLNKITTSGVDPSRLCFEIKESDTLNSPINAAEISRQLQSLGCSIALDNFGAEITSFSTIKSLRVDALKIDGSLIAAISSGSPIVNSENADLLLLKSIQSFASSMGLVTVAKHVDSPDVIATMRNIGIDCAQGFAIAETIPMSELAWRDSGDLRAA